MCKAREQEATAANVSCSTGGHFEEFSFPDRGALYCNRIGEGGGGVGEKRVACCKIANAGFTCVLLSVWLAFSCGGKCIGAHAVKWGWQVYRSPAFAFSCNRKCIVHLSVMRRFWPARQRCPRPRRLCEKSCSGQVCGHGVAQAVEWLDMRS